MNESYEVDELPHGPRKEIAAADRELLELAARALGARFEEVDGEGYGNLHFEDGSTVFAWNSLRHSDDAFNLMVDLDLDVAQAPSYREAQVGGALQQTIFQPWADDKQAATRRAVTRAAAEIGKVKLVPECTTLF